MLTSSTNTDIHVIIERLRPTGGLGKPSFSDLELKLTLSHLPRKSLD